MEDNVKRALLDGTATIQTEIEVLQPNNEASIILTEENGIVSWDYEDFRYVKDEGWIGQFIAKQVNGTIKNISDDFSMTDKEFNIRMGVKIDNETMWYSLGNFLVNKVTDDEVNDKTTFEALDYTKKFNQKYVDNITYPCTALELAQNVCQQCGCELGNTDFKHNDWEITGNAFTNGESCRDVLKAIGKLAYSWVRVDWDNKVYLDFTVNKTTEEYNKITNHEYYTLKTQKEKIGAINRVVIGYKDIEGERTKVENAEDIEVNGVHEITIFDNPLVYNQELREKAIMGAKELLGLEYMPMEMLTVGHPWLRGDELLEVTDMEGKVHKTIPFDRTIQYFGHIKTKINVATNTKTNTEYSYEGGVGGRLRKAEISVDKINGQIIEIIKEQDETTEKLNETISTVDETKQTISKVETTVTDITTTTQTSTGGNNLHIEEALESNALDYVIEGMSYQEINDDIPSPDTPSEIETLKDLKVKIAGSSEYQETEVTIKIQKYNYVDYTKKENIKLHGAASLTFLENGIRLKHENNDYPYAGCFIYFDNPQDLLGKILTLSCDMMSSYNINPYVSLLFIQDDDIIEQICILRSNQGKITVQVPDTFPGTNDATANSLALYFYVGVSTVGDYTDFTNIKLYIGYDEDWELCKVDDMRDVLNVVSGSLTKRTDKLILSGNENWVMQGDLFYIDVASFDFINKSKLMCNRFKNYNTYDEMIAHDYGIGMIYDDLCRLYIRNVDVTTVEDFKQWLSNNNTEVYYQLDKQYEVDLENTNIPLFEGTNNISLIQDLETTTSIRYLRETPLSGDSLLKQQLDATNDSLSDTTNQVNQNTSDINDTNVNLNNNYYNKNQIDIMNSSTSQELTQIKNSVETKVTAEDLNIAIAEIKTTGVTSVTTETGYTFDKDGLKIQKSDSEMSSLLDNDGLVVKRDNTEVLTVRSAGVETENLTVRTYFTIGDNTRVENYKGGTGFFYVGGAD